jgi:hypothetical protein
LQLLKSFGNKEVGGICPSTLIFKSWPFKSINQYMEIPPQQKLNNLLLASKLNHPFLDLEVSSRSVISEVFLEVLEFVSILGFLEAKNVMKSILLCR